MCSSTGGTSHRRLIAPSDASHSGGRFSESRSRSRSSAKSSARRSRPPRNASRTRFLACDHVPFLDAAAPLLEATASLAARPAPETTRFLTTLMAVDASPEALDDSSLEEICRRFGSGGGPAYWGYGVETAMAGWAANNGCDGPPVATAIVPGTTRVAHERCADDARVVLHVLDGIGHVWPGSGFAFPESRFGSMSPLDATALILAFFERHGAFR